MCSGRSNIPGVRAFYRSIDALNGGKEYITVRITFFSISLDIIRDDANDMYIDDATYYSIVNDLNATLCIDYHMLFLSVPDAQMSQQVSDVIATSSSFACL